jgi:HK97 family phage prohead protease
MEVGMNKKMVTERLKFMDVYKNQSGIVAEIMAATGLKINADTEFIRKFYVADLKEINTDARTVDAYITTGARDRDNEILKPEGWDLSFYMKNPVVLYGHNYNILPDGTIPVTGHNESIGLDSKGLVAKTKYNETKIGTQVFNLRKSGDLRAYSVGFIPLEWVDADGKENARRTYSKQVLLEYSDVIIPCNPEALQRNIKEGKITIDEPQLIKDLETGAIPAENQNIVEFKSGFIKIENDGLDFLFQFSADGKVWGVNEKQDDGKWLNQAGKSLIIERIGATMAEAKQQLAAEAAKAAQDAAEAQKAAEAKAATEAAEKAAGMVPVKEPTNKSVLDFVKPPKQEDSAKKTTPDKLTITEDMAAKALEALKEALPGAVKAAATAAIDKATGKV